MVLARFAVGGCCWRSISKYHRCFDRGAGVPRWRAAELAEPDALRFMPALNVTREEISMMIDCLDTVLTQMGAARMVA